MQENFNNHYRALKEAIDGMPVVDTHEHLIPEAMRMEGKVDFFTITMSQYASSDLISAGMPLADMEKLRAYGTKLDEKIHLFAPFWEKAANTAYCRALRIAAKDLYGIETINEQTLPELNRRVTEHNKPGLYKNVLKEKCHIKYCLWDQFFTETPERDDFFRLALRLDNLVMINGAEDIKQLEHKYNVSIRNPEAVEEILEIVITNHKPRGLTAIKTALAYERTLDFTRVSRAEAILSMERILRSRFTESDTKVLQDYLMYSLAQKCAWHNLTMQVHTGLLEGNGNDIRNANPALLSPLISHNPDTRFDLFHGAYPYGGMLSAMAKMFPHVYVDMAWAHLISPLYARRYLAEWLETVPVNKILGFGGDYLFVEGVYGHLQMAKENIACVLAEKMAEGLMTADEAKRYAAMMLSENAERLFA